MNKFLTLFLFAALFSSCNYIFAIFDDNLRLPKEPYSGTQLKLDGFYYTELQNYEGTLYDFYALYANGVILNIGASNNFDYYKTQFSEKSFQHNHSWGVFIVRKDSIAFERWYPAEISKCSVRAGRILNDSTFMITEVYTLRNGKKKDLRKENAIYHYTQYSPKPDSTNRFIP